MRKTLVNYFRAAYPAIAIPTTDEARACAEIVAAAKVVGSSAVTWSATEGAIDVGSGGKSLPDSEDLLAVCKLGLERERTVWILRDPHTWPFDRDPILARAFREFLQGAPAVGSTVVILAPSYIPHPTVEKLVVIVEHELPSSDDLAKVAAGIAGSWKEDGKAPVEGSGEVIRALGGLTASEAENALSLSLVETGKFDASVIYREKVKAVKKSGLLEVIETDPRGLDAVGGLGQLKAWIKRRRRVWSPEAAKFKLPQPKGVLLVGVPGAGKTLSAKAIAVELGVPLLRLDIGNMFNSLVGESEARIRDALKQADAMSPCVLLVDEIDKGLAGSSGGGNTDGGVGRRVFGTIITWMQDRRRGVFLVATANQVEGLPPELLRKGRFDEIFAVDLPSTEERQAIFSIQLRRIERDPLQFDLLAMAQGTDSFTGSEIEAVVDEALFLAFDLDRELETGDILTAASATVPLAVTAKSQIDAIREWSRGRARPASFPEASTPVQGAPVRILRKVITSTGDEN